MIAEKQAVCIRIGRAAARLAAGRRDRGASRRPAAIWYGTGEPSGVRDAGAPASGAGARGTATPGGLTLRIYVDADACPVKQEVFRVARRHRLGVTLVAASWMRIPEGPDIALEVVGQGFDSADDWIVEHVSADDLVVTGDIPLAARCIARGACVLGPSGRPFTEANIGDTLATRNLLADMRSAGIESGGPAAFDPRDRSRFLQELHRLIEARQRERG
jgi:uncharacterized protein